MKQNYTVTLFLCAFLSISAQEVLWQKDIKSSTQDFLSQVTTTINTSLITTKPNTPKSVLVKGFGYNEEEEIQQYVSACTKDGYVVKSLNGGGGSGGSWWFLVMEKY